MRITEWKRAKEAVRFARDVVEILSCYFFTERINVIIRLRSKYFSRIANIKKKKIKEKKRVSAEEKRKERERALDLFRRK